MPGIHSLDFALLESSIFGVNQGYTGRYIGSGLGWVLGILNPCLSVTSVYLMISEGYFDVYSEFSVDSITRKLYYYVAIFVIVFMQLRYLCRRHEMAPVGRELSQLCQLSSWTGNVCGCIARIVLYLMSRLLHQFLPIYKEDWEGDVDRHRVMILFDWSNFVPSAAAEFLDQAMLLFQHEFKVLRKITEEIAMRRGRGIEKLRALNRRHASLSALSNAVAGITGIDTLLIVESERFLLLLSIFMQVNLIMRISGEWRKKLIDIALYFYRIERIAHHCFRGYRVTVEADRFVSTLDEIDPLDFEDDEFFTEFQIFRKQAKLRKPRFDCDRFLKLDMKLFFLIFKDMVTLIIILIQLTTDPTIGTSNPANTTEAYNASEYFLGFSDIHPNSSTAVIN